MSFSLPWTINKLVSTNINNSDSITGTYSSVSFKVNGKTELNSAVITGSVGIGKAATSQLDVSGDVAVSGNITVNGNITMKYSKILGGLVNLGEIKTGLGSTLTTLTVPMAQQYQCNSTPTASIYLPDLSYVSQYYPSIQIANNTSSALSFYISDPSAVFRSYKGQYPGDPLWFMDANNPFAILTYNPTLRQWVVNMDGSQFKNITYYAAGDTTDIYGSKFRSFANSEFYGTTIFNTNLPTSTLTPTTSTQLITKAYADATYVTGSSSGYALLSGTNAFTGTNTFNTNLPTSTLTPTTSTQLITKSYGDGAYARLSGFNAFTSQNTFDTFLPTSTLTPTSATQLITKAYADSAYPPSSITAKLPGSNAFTGTNTFNTNLPTSTLTPTTSTQLITKAYGDATYALSGSGASLTANQQFTGVNDFSNNFSVSCPTVGGIAFKINGATVLEIGQYALYSPLSIAYGSGIDQITFNIPPVFKSNLIFSNGYTMYLGDPYGAGYMQVRWGGISITDNAYGTTFFNTNKMEPYSTNAVNLYTTTENSQTVTFGNSGSTNALSVQFETTAFNRNVNFAVSPLNASQSYSTNSSTISLTGGQDVFITSTAVVVLYIPQPSAADVGKSFYITKNVSTSWVIAVSRAVGSTQTFSVDGSTTALSYTFGLSETWVKFTCIASTGVCWKVSNQIVTDNRNTVCMTALSCLPPTYTIPTNKTTINTVILGYNAFAGSYTGGHNSSNTVIGSAAGFSATNSPAGEVLLGNDTYYTTTSMGAYNTAVGYRAGYTYQSTGGYNTLIGAYADFNAANSYGNSTAIGTGAVIDASSQVVLGRTTEYVKIPSANIQYGNSYRFNSVYQTIGTTSINWNTTPPTNYPRYILFSAAGTATTTLTLPLISNASVYEGMEFIFRRTNTATGAQTTSILSVAVGGGNDVIFGINVMTTATAVNVLASGTGAAAMYGRIVCVNKSTSPNQWAYFPS